MNLKKGQKLLILIILLLSISFLYLNKQKVIEEIEVGSEKIKVEIVTKIPEKIRGLSDHHSLPADRGMLFIYDKPDNYGIWMKDMHFPIDIIWIDKNKKVIDITSNVSPQSFPRIFYSSHPSQYIIEVNANWAEIHRIKIGDAVIF